MMNVSVYAPNKHIMTRKVLCTIFIYLCFCTKYGTSERNWRTNEIS